MYFYRACGVQSPSWLEIRNFVMFLDIQLRLCQNPSFCNDQTLGEEMKGFKGFVVKFMIQMSKVGYSFAVNACVLHVLQCMCVHISD